MIRSSLARFALLAWVALASADDWPGVWADGIDAGVVAPDGTAYLFKRGHYFQANSSALPVLPPGGTPK